LCTYLSKQSKAIYVFDKQNFNLNCFLSDFTLLNSKGTLNFAVQNLVEILIFFSSNSCGGIIKFCSLFGTIEIVIRRRRLGSFSADNFLG
jgi:hypothetical protein